MNRHIVLTACVGLTLCAVTGAYATRKWFYDPFQDTSDRHHQTWRAVPDLDGEVKLLDRDGTALGSDGTGGGSRAGVTADVQIDGRHYPLSRAGRHSLLSDSGVVLGYAELVPENDAQRAELQKAHDKKWGIEEKLPFNRATDDGYGKADGYFGNHREIT